MNDEWITKNYPLTNEQIAFLFSDTPYEIMEAVWTHEDDNHARALAESAEYKALFSDMPFCEVYVKFWACVDLNNDRWVQPVPTIKWSAWAKTIPRQSEAAYHQSMIADD